MTHDVSPRPPEAPKSDQRAPAPRHDEPSGTDRPSMTADPPVRPTPKVSDTGPDDGRDREGPKAREMFALPRDLGARRATTGGHAPAVVPGNRAARRAARRGMRRGYTPVSVGRPKVAHRILPRSVIGISSMFFAAGLGAAVAGSAFYAYYDNRLAENERTVAQFVERFDSQYVEAAERIDGRRVEAIEEIRTELGPLADFATDAQGVIAIPEQFGESVWLVETTDSEGTAVRGSAFAVVGHEGGTALVTSYQLVAARAVSPGPEVVLVKGDQRMTAEVRSLDQANGVAVLWLPLEIPTLELADADLLGASIGGRVFAVGGLGTRGAAATPGVLVDVSDVGVQHTSAVGTFYEGGPLVNGDGVVIGVASAGYAPLGVDPGSVGQSPSVQQLCAVALRCPAAAQPSLSDAAPLLADELSPEDGAEGVEAENSTEQVDG